MTYCIEMLMWEEPECLPATLQTEQLEEEDTFCTILFNDETHTYDQVINALTKAIDCDQTAAVDFATSVDREGRSVVKSGGFSDCEAARKIIEKQTSRQGQTPLRVVLYKTSVASHQHYAVRIFSWLQEILAWSCGLRELFAKVVLDESVSKRGAASFAETLMLADTRLWKLARVQSRQLFMAAILMDADCKRRFSVLFTRLYPELMKQFVEDDHDHSISVTSESVQLYTVPSIARWLATEHNLLEVILTTYRDLCLVHTVGAGSTRKFSFVRHEKSQVFRRGIYCLVDLKYVLLNRPGAVDEWSDQLRESFTKGFNVFLEILQCMQGMDAVIRQTGQHVEFEAEWEGAFNLQIRLSDILAIVLDWCRSDLMVLVEAYTACVATVADITSPTAEAGIAADFAKMASHQSTVVAVIAGAAATVVTATISSSGASALHAAAANAAQKAAATVAEPQSRYEVFSVAGKSTECIRYDFASQPVSVHQPVSRLLAGLCACVNGVGLSLTQLHLAHGAGLPIRDLIEPSLRALVLAAQCHAGMWRRNGYALQNQVYFYQSVKCRAQMYDKDVLMMQLGAALMDPNDFTLILIHKFGLLNWSREDYDTDVTPEDSVKQLITLAEHFLKLLIVILCERYVEGVGLVTPADVVKREIIHQLCIQAMSHSELTKALADDPYRENNVDDVVW